MLVQGVEPDERGICPKVWLSASRNARARVVPSRSATLAAKPSTLRPVTLSIEIPEATLRALGPSPSEAEGKVRLAAAMKLHELGHLSAGAAADLAGIPKVEFLHKLADFGVEAFRVTPVEFDQDQDTLRRSLG
jgi:predicted HTH domain antitoxin